MEAFYVRYDLGLTQKTLNVARFISARVPS